MAVPVLQPFKEEDCACLDRVLENAVNLEELIAALGECGITIDELAARNSGCKDLAARLKAKFFPNRV